MPKSFGGDGGLHLKLDDSRSVQFDPSRQLHLDYGYAMTSHSSHGQTADSMLVHVDTELSTKDLLNSRMAYVAISRGARDVQIFTNDVTTPGHELSRDVSHAAAIQQAPISEAIEHAAEQRPTLKHEIDQEFGIAL